MKCFSKIIGLCFLVSLILPEGVVAADNSFKPASAKLLSKFIFTPSLNSAEFWEQSVDDFAASNSQFSWSKEKIAKGKIVLYAKNLSLFRFDGLPVLELTAGFSQDEKLKMIKVNLWNKGDSLAKEYMDVKIVLRKFKDHLKLFPKSSLKKSATQTTKQQRYKVGNTYVSLLFKNQEYYSIALTSALKKEEDANGKQTKKDFRADLKENVKQKENGDVVIENIPMVDQGQKSYCAPATCARILLYYGADVDMHFLADSLETKDGTTLSDIERLLKRLCKGQPFMCKKEKTFNSGRIQKYIDKGIPLMWYIPNHIRIIIGYNKKEKTLIYTDSWGQQFKYEKISVKDAKRLTEGFFILK